MFLRQHARRQAVLAIVSQHRHRGLRHDRSVIEVGGHEMDRRAMQLDAGHQRLAMGREAGKTRQQRRMNIEHAARIMGDERRRQDPQEARQHHQVR